MQFLEPTFLIALVIAITIHEFSHAWAATMLGDPTAQRQGRVSLNPLRHLDPFGTILLFLVGIGWGKPVPFDARYLKHPARDSALIALAGPFSNLVTAFIFALALRYLIADGGHNIFVFQLLESIVSLNLVLMTFNLLPLPPLDGSKIVFSILPKKWYPFLFRYKNYGYGFLFILLLSPHIFGVSVIGKVIFPVVNFFWKILVF